MGRKKLSQEDLRIGTGGALSCITTLLIFGLWRAAITFDTASSGEIWTRLVYEYIAAALVLPITFAVFTLIGAVLVMKGNGAIHQSVFSSMTAAVLYAGWLYWADALGARNAGILASPQISFWVLVLSGAAGGMTGHVGWFPPHSRKD